MWTQYTGLLWIVRNYPFFIFFFFFSLEQESSGYRYNDFFVVQPSVRLWKYIEEVDLKSYTGNDQFLSFCTCGIRILHCCYRSVLQSWLLLTWQHFVFVRLFSPRMLQFSQRNRLILKSQQYTCDLRYSYLHLRLICFKIKIKALFQSRNWSRKHQMDLSTGKMSAKWHVLPRRQAAILFTSYRLWCAHCLIAINHSDWV